MAGPIKISVLAETKPAIKSVNDFATATEGAVGRASGHLEEGTRRIRATGDESKKGFDKAGEAADELDTKAMGFRDTMTGVQDSMKGASLVAKGDLFNGFLTLGMGVGDLGSGLYNFLIPGIKGLVGNAKIASAATKVWAGVQAVLNLVMSLNPIALVIIAIVALVAIFVIAYKKSDTFRRIVDGAFRGVLSIATSVWNWFKGTWPTILGFLANPVGTAVGLIRRHADDIWGFFKGIPGKIKGAFSGAGDLLRSIGSSIIDGLISGIKSAFHRVQDTLSSLTNLLPSWKGPADKDAKLLTRNGELVIEGFAKGLENRYGDVRRSLGGFTGSLASSAGSIVASTSPSGQQQKLLVDLEIAPSGDRLIDTLMELLADRIRVKGGNVQRVLGSN